VCEVSLPSAGRKEQDDVGEDPLLDKAEQQARRSGSWGPVKQKLREWNELKQARSWEVTITHALERWLASVKADSDSGNEHYP